MKKGLHLIVPFPYLREGGGGISSAIRQFAAEAARQGHRITLVSTLKDGERADVRDGNVRTVRLRTGSASFLRRIREYGMFNADVRRRLARNEWGPFDAVLGVSNAAGAGRGFPLVFRSAAGPISWELEMWRQIWKRWKRPSLAKRCAVTFDFWLQRCVEKKNVRAAKGLLCQSRAIAEAYAKEYGVRVPAQVPCTGVDTNVFSPGKRKPLFGVGKIMLFVGGFSGPKAGFMLERALPLIFKKHPDAKLVIVGEQQHTMKLAPEYFSRVLLLNKTPHAELSAYYRAADVFLFPTVVNEGFPNAVLEAMASGLPIVMTRIPGIEEYLDASSAFIVPKYDVEGFAAGVNRVLSSTELRKKLGKNALKESKRFAWPLVAKEMLNFIGSFS